MRAFQLVLLLLSLLAVTMKLFTYEFYLLDDPTSGVALRSVPGFESRRAFGSSSESQNALIVVQDENDFVGGGIYRFIVQVGWIGLPLLSMAAVAATRLRRMRSTSSV